MTWKEVLVHLGWCTLVAKACSGVYTRTVVE